MDLVTVLWIIVAACALVLAGDALAARLVRGGRLPSATRRSTTVYGVMMLVFSLACLVIAIVAPVP